MRVGFQPLVVNISSFMFRMLKPFQYHHFVPISVLLDAVILAFLSPTATTFGGGGYSDIVLPDNKLVTIT